MSNDMYQQTNLFDDSFGLFDGMQEGVSDTSLVTEGLNPKKTAKKKEKQEKKTAGMKKGALGKTKLKAPVTVLGCNWRYVYEGEGEVFPEEVLKAAFQAGFKEVALARIYTGAEESLLYVNPFAACETMDDRAVPFLDGKVSIVLGQFQVQYEVTDFDGMEEEEISILDLTEKFVKTYPDFAGVSLYAEKGIAVPVFEEQTEEKDLTEDVLTVWQGTDAQDMTKEAFHLAYDVSDEGVTMNLYRSENGTLFVGYTGRVVTCSPDAFGIKRSEQKTVKESYTLPLMLVLANFAKSLPLTEEMFEGKKKVTREDVLDYLKKLYRMFSQKDRKIDYLYDRSEHVLSVAVTSGAKGHAIVIPFPAVRGTESCRRVEETMIGTFTGWIGGNGRIEWVTYKPAIPKIPRSLLDSIIDTFRDDLPNESMMVVRWNCLKKVFRMYKPRQICTRESVKYEQIAYEKGECDVLIMHSHNYLDAFWSPVDDRDECGLCLYGVVGEFGKDDEKAPVVRIRVGMDGAFRELEFYEWNALFTSGEGEAA